MKRNGIVQAIELTNRQSTVLRNMHWRRRKAICQRIKNGASFSAAEKGTQHVFDTVGWHEITSRLRRARGLVQKWTKVIEDKDKSLVASRRIQARELAARISDDAMALRDLVDESAEARERQPFSTAKAGTNGDQSGAKFSDALVVGKFKAAFKFVAKSRRDAPHLLRHGIKPTGRERATVVSEIGCLLEDCAALLS